MTETSPAPISILLTGGSGFLGKAIAGELLDPASPVPCSKLRIFDVNEYDGPADPRIEFMRGDVRDRDALARACAGVQAVVHSAAIVDWGTHPEEEVLAVNYTGTMNVIEACVKAGIGYLVFTSSLDAIYNGKAMRGIDESVPYPDVHPNMYCRSKALAEQAVMAADRPGLATCSLRPADIYGPADPFHIGSLIDMAKGGFYVRLGDGTALSQHVFVGNMAWSHVLALRALMDGNRELRGKAYFISDAPASNFFRFFDSIVAGAGYRIRPANLWIPRPVAYAIGAMTEFGALLLRPVKKINPKFSRFAVIYTCSDFTFNTDRALRDFGFVPKYEHAEALEKTIAFYRLPT